MELDGRTIFHVDVNSAFLSWSALKLLEEDPGAVDLRTIPSGVGGDVKTRHGIITAKSIPAKKYGVQTGEPVVKALQKCPQLVLVPPDFETYRKYSRALMEILARYTPLIQQVSIDEAYMDLTDRIWQSRSATTSGNSSDLLLTLEFPSTSSWQKRPAILKNRTARTPCIRRKYR